MNAVNTPAPANQSTPLRVTGAKPWRDPSTNHPSAEIAAVSSSDKNAPLSAAPRGAPRMTITLEIAKHSAEASA